MSVKKALSLSRWETKKTASTPTKVKKTRSLVSGSDTSDRGSEVAGAPAKKQRKGSRRRFSFVREITVEPEGARSLEEVDSGKLKAEIKRWAKRVAAYARQVSGRIGRSKTMSSRASSSVDNSMQHIVPSDEAR